MFSRHKGSSSASVLLFLAASRFASEPSVVFLPPYMIFPGKNQIKTHLNYSFFLGAHLQVDEKRFVPTFYKIQCLPGASTGKEKGTASL